MATFCHVHVLRKLRLDIHYISMLKILCEFCKQDCSKLISPQSKVFFLQKRLAMQRCKHYNYHIVVYSDNV